MRKDSLFQTVFFRSTRPSQGPWVSTPGLGLRLVQFERVSSPVPAWTTASSAGIHPLLRRKERPLVRLDVILLHTLRPYRTSGRRDSDQPRSPAPPPAETTERLWQNLWEHPGRNGRVSPGCFAHSHDLARPPADTSIERFSKSCVTPCPHRYMYPTMFWASAFPFEASGAHSRIAFS